MLYVRYKNDIDVGELVCCYVIEEVFFIFQGKMKLFVTEVENALSIYSTFKSF